MYTLINGEMGPQREETEKVRGAQKQDKNREKEKKIGINKSFAGKRRQRFHNYILKQERCDLVGLNEKVRQTA